MQNKSLYQIIWRWHFYAGLFCIPFILTLSVSGGIYLFKPQIDSWIDEPFNNLPVMGERTLPNEQIKAALGAVPGALFTAYHLPQQEHSAVKISVSQGAEKSIIYVDPYTLNILRKIKSDEQFIEQIRSFHGELLSGDVGSVLVELAGCWAIVLIITGLYLWWPRNAKGIAGVLYPRLGKSGRVFWKDLHSVLGMWVSVFTLFLLVSGLPWALVWGTAFKEVRSWNSAPVSQDWTASKKEKTAAWRSSSVSQYDLTPQILMTANQLDFAHPVNLSVANEKTNQWKLASLHQNRLLRETAWLDGRTGKVIKQKSFNDNKTLDKVIGVGIAAHEGHLFGWFNQLLGLLTVICLIVIAVSGCVLWYRRKNPQQLGAPPVNRSAKAGKTVAVIVLTLAVFLPLLAISLISIILLEYFVLRRVKTISVWLGLKSVG